MIPIHDLIGHLAYITILLGTRLLHKKNLHGWLFRVAGDIIWAILGLYLGLSSVWFWSSIFAINDMWGFMSWKRTKEKINVNKNTK